MLSQVWDNFDAWWHQRGLLWVWVILSVFTDSCCVHKALDYLPTGWPWVHRLCFEGSLQPTARPFCPASLLGSAVREVLLIPSPSLVILSVLCVCLCASSICCPSVNKVVFYKILVFKSIPQPIVSLHVSSIHCTLWVTGSLTVGANGLWPFSLYSQQHIAANSKGSGWFTDSLFGNWQKCSVHNTCALIEI